MTLKLKLEKCETLKVSPADQNIAMPIHLARQED